MRHLRGALTVVWSDLILVAERAQGFADMTRGAGVPRLAREAESIGRDVQHAVTALWDLTLEVSRQMRTRQERPTRPQRARLTPPSPGIE
jgi:hypothetical protein